MLSNNPVKGTADWFPEEYAARKYIFDTWRSVCQKFGYLEYLTPLVEMADVYRAKSGEDAGNKELTVFRDRGDRELAIRPEMTPSVTRMVSRNYESVSKPIRLFSVANFFRNENPQRGRNREFWQLNADIFGSNSLNADVEILQLALEIMLAFNPPAGSFVLYLNDRQLIEAFVTKYLRLPVEKVQEATRILDKFNKLPRPEFLERLRAIGAEIDNEQELADFLSRDDATLQKLRTDILADEPGMQRLNDIVDQLGALGYGDYLKWNPGMVRGFDYYDGMIFEVFDTHPDNTRALFGGGRYNGLAGIFGRQSFPAVGFAPGDESTKLFLESWNLIPQTSLRAENYYFPLLAENLSAQAMKLAQKLRQDGLQIEQGLELQKLGNALEFAAKNAFAGVIIFGEQEQSSGKFLIRDLTTGEQTEQSLT